VAASTESGTASSYNAYNAGDTGNIGGYDVNSAYYAQMYEQYYGSQAQVVMHLVSYC